MAAVFQRAAARRDLVAHYVYLAEHAGEEVADRFLANAEVSFTGLAERPEIGAPLALRRPELAGLRKWRVKGFEKFLIFYMPRRDGVTIVRVLHAAQDWWSLLGIDAANANGATHCRNENFVRAIDRAITVGGDCSR